MTKYIVEFDYTAKSEDELTIKKGDIITNGVPAEEGWLKGECHGTVGLFPENFVVSFDKEKAKIRTLLTAPIGNRINAIRKRSYTNADFSAQTGTIFQVRAVYTYLPIHDDELSIKPNDVINVIRLAEEGWYEGELNGKIGFFPSNYVTRISADKTKINESPKLKPMHTLVRKTNPTKARVLYDYKALTDDELNLTANDIVTVLDKNSEDEGWWKGELNGRIGVFPDNYVEEIPTSTNLKSRAKTPDAEVKQPTHTIAKRKSANDERIHNYSNESYCTIVRKEDDDLSRHNYAEINNLISKDKLNEIKKQKPILTKRPSLPTTHKQDIDFHTYDEPNRFQQTISKNEEKVLTPSPPSTQRDPGQLGSPRYANRSLSLSNPNSLSLTKSLDSTYANVPTIDQLHKEFIKLKSTLDDMKLKYSDQIQDLINELDEEKKARVALQIEIERLQKLFQKSSRFN